jgi:hypothetical protein
MRKLRKASPFLPMFCIRGRLIRGWTTTSDGEEGETDEAVLVDEDDREGFEEEVEDRVDEAKMAVRREVRPGKEGDEEDGKRKRTCWRRRWPGRSSKRPPSSS